MNKHLLAALENSRQYTLAVAAAMPESNYSFKPAEAVMNFGEQLHHIAYGIEWWHANYIRGTKTEWAPPEAKKGKEELKAALEKLYAELGKTLGGNLSEEAIHGFYATLDHITHHRAQAISYLRCKGIAPPEYVY